MKHAHNSSSVSRVNSDTILSIPITSLGPLPVLYPNRSYPCTSSILLSILRLSILATIYAVCVMRLTVRWSLNFFSFWLFLLNNHCKFSEILGPLSSFTCVLTSRVNILKLSCPIYQDHFLRRFLHSLFSCISFCFQIFSL